MLLNRIELFVAVAKLQSLGMTARNMHVSASSVCQRLKSLETELGAKLYKRNHAGIELTEAGRIVLTAASHILSQIETLKKTLNPASATRIQSLSVAGTHTPSAKYLPAAIAAFQRKNPHVKVTFLTADRFNIEKSLRHMEVDVAIIQNPSESSDFYLEHFADDTLVLFAHPAHPLGRKKRLSLEDLVKAPLIIRDGKGSTDKMLKRLKAQGLALNIVLRCASPDAVKAAVRRKTGIGVLYHDYIAEDLNRKALKVLKFCGLPKFVGSSYIVCNKKKNLSVAANDFLMLLRAKNGREKAASDILRTSESKNLLKQPAVKLPEGG